MDNVKKVLLYGNLLTANFLSLNAQSSHPVPFLLTQENDMSEDLYDEEDFIREEGGQKGYQQNLDEVLHEHLAPIASEEGVVEENDHRTTESVTHIVEDTAEDDVNSFQGIQLVDLDPPVFQSDDEVDQTETRVEEDGFEEDAEATETAIEEEDEAEIIEERDEEGEEEALNAPLPSRFGVPESVNISNLMPELKGNVNDDENVETVKGWEEKDDREREEQLAKLSEKDRTIYQNIDFAKKNTPKDEEAGDTEGDEQNPHTKGKDDTLDEFDLDDFDPSAYFKPTRKPNSASLDLETAKKDLQSEQDELFGEARTTRKGNKNSGSGVKETVPSGEQNLARGILKELSETEW